MLDDASAQSAFSTCLELETALAEYLQGRPSRKNRDWAGLGYPCIGRGTNAIFPLLVAAETATRESDAEQLLADVAERLWRHWGYWYGGHDYRVGGFDGRDEWGKKALGERLQTVDESSRRRGFWWDVGDDVVVFVRSVRGEPRVETLALHVVPRDWVFVGLTSPTTKAQLSRCRSVEREVQAADLDWTPPEPGTHSWVTSRNEELHDSV